MGPKAAHLRGYINRRGAPKKTLIGAIPEREQYRTGEQYALQYRPSFAPKP